jgi:hypothetical protein
MQEHPYEKTLEYRVSLCVPFINPILSLFLAITRRISHLIALSRRFRAYGQFVAVILRVLE